MLLNFLFFNLHKSSFNSEIITFHLISSSCCKLIKNVKISFAWIMTNNPRLFKQKIRNFSTAWFTAAVIELHLDVFSLKKLHVRQLKDNNHAFIQFTFIANTHFVHNIFCWLFHLFKHSVYQVCNYEWMKYTYKSTAVIIVDGLCVTKRFQKRIGFQNDFFHLLHFFATATDPRYVRHYIFRCYCFSCSWFSTANQHLEFNHLFKMNFLTVYIIITKFTHFFTLL